VPDLAAMLVRRSLDVAQPVEASCSDCRRTPVPGERLHEVDRAGLLCDLCFAGLPDERRVALRSERVGASARRLAVVPRVA
jgi:hypothetical protein